jgi:hypothetical protein
MNTAPSNSLRLPPSAQGCIAPRHIGMAAVLAVAGMISVPLLMPYLLAVMPGLAAKIPLPLPLFVLLQMAQAGAFLLLLAWAGLRLGYRFGLDAPYLRSWLQAGATPAKSPAWTLAIVLGLAVGVACLAIDLALHGFPVTRASSHGMSVAAAWKGLLASFYGGITEEITCRLFLVAVFVWIGARLQRSASPGAATYGAAIVAAAVLFGVAHLPALAQTGSLTMAGITRTIGLNALCGIAFGWLFWRHGLEHAMAAHFSTDIVLHVAAPLLG